MITESSISPVVYDQQSQVDAALIEKLKQKSEGREAPNSTVQGKNNQGSDAMLTEAMNIAVDYYSEGP